MLRILTWIIGLPLAVAAIGFAVANRQMIVLDLWPLPFTLSIPVYLTALGSLALGLVLGLLIGGTVAGGRAARRARDAETRARVAEADAASLRGRAEAAEAATALPPPGTAA